MVQAELMISSVGAEPCALKRTALQRSYVARPVGLARPVERLNHLVQWPKQRPTSQLPQMDALERGARCHTTEINENCSPTKSDLQAAVLPFTIGYARPCIDRG